MLREHAEPQDDRRGRDGDGGLGQAARRRTANPNVAASSASDTISAGSPDMPSEGSGT
jgi:hypothetical protein